MAEDKRINISVALKYCGVNIVTLEGTAPADNPLIIPMYGFRKEFVVPYGFTKGKYFTPEDLMDRVRESDASNTQEALKQLSSATIGLATFSELMDA